jgi:hypothetical protein
MFHRLEKLLVQIRAPAANCLRNPRIACNANLVQQYRWENLNLNKKWILGLKIGYPSAILIFYKSNPTITPSHISSPARCWTCVRIVILFRPSILNLDIGRNILRYKRESSCWIIYCLEEELALQTVRLASQFGQWMKYQSAPSNSLPMETNFLNSPFHAELTISVLPTGRMFGCITQKRVRVKKWAAGQISGRILLLLNYLLVLMGGRIRDEFYQKE